MCKSLFIIVGVCVVIGAFTLYVLVGKHISEYYTPTTPTVHEDVSQKLNESRSVSNAAEVYCEEGKQGRYHLINVKKGQIGMCELPDGRWCEEWTLLRNGECVRPAVITDALLYSE